MKKPAPLRDFISYDEIEDQEEESDSNSPQENADFIPYEEEAENDLNFGQGPSDSAEEESEVKEEVENKEETPENPSFWQSVASHPVTQTLLGAARRYTFPLDIVKALAVGGGLNDIDELESEFEKAGKPFDRESYINAVFQAAESVPTQQLLEDTIKDKTGVDLAPKDAFSKIVRGGAEIVATGGRSILKEPVKQVAKRVAGGVGGATVGEGAKQLGANETLADLLSFALGGAAGAKKEPFKLTGEQAKNAAVAEKHNLRKFGGLQREEPLKNAIVSPKAQKKAVEELSESSKKAIDKVIADKIPITKQRAMGVDLEDAYTKAYLATERKAKAIDSLNARAKQAGHKTKEIDIQPVLNKIRKNIDQIKKTAPSLSPSDKAALKELRKQYKALTNPPKKAPPPIYGPNGQVLNPGSKKRTPKQITAEQALDQYRNFNEETRGIYRKPEFSGNEEVVKNLYGELKTDLIDALEKTSPELAKDLRFANKIYHETSKLNQVEGLIEKAFDQGYDSKKLNQILGGKRNRAFLQRDIGKGAVKEMQDIARYGMAAEKQVFKNVKNPDTIKEILTGLTPLKASLLVAKHTAAKPLYLFYEIPRAVSRRAKGALMLSDKTRQSYANYLKEAASPSSAAFKKASEALSKSIDDEFGSEEEFLKFLDEDEGD